MTRKDPITRHQLGEATSLQQEPSFVVRSRAQLSAQRVGCVPLLHTCACAAMRCDHLVMHGRGVAKVKVRHGNRRPLWRVCPASPPRAAS
jgi:hypothetical protein